MIDVVNLAECRAQHERLMIAVAGMLEAQHVNDATLSDVRRFTRVAQGRDEKFCCALYEAARAGRPHDEAAAWARGVLEQVPGWREAIRASVAA